MGVWPAGTCRTVVIGILKRITGWYAIYHRVEHRFARFLILLLKPYLIAAGISELIKACMYTVVKQRKWSD